MAQATLKELRILLIEDDQDVREMINTYLESLGHIVKMRVNGDQGLEALRKSEFDLVITDIHMAGTNGFHLLKRARTTYPRIGIVLMTAYEDRYPMSEALQAGADGYISKPFTLAKFSFIFERAYWNALSRQDWWDKHETNDKPGPPESIGF